MNIVRYPVPWQDDLAEREAEFDAGEAFEAMREHQATLRLDDHVPLTEEQALAGGSFWLNLLVLAAAIATICVVGVTIHLSIR